jgi:RNA polymerase sigma factor (sigma-70 family)
VLDPHPLGDPAPLIRRVYAYVAYQIGHGAEAEDVTSDTFERAFRYRHTFDPRKGDVVSWLVGIARRCVADSVAARLVPVGEIWDQAAPGNMDEDALLRLEVADAMTKLPQRDRELLALRYGADLTARQIGELVDLSTNAVEVGLHRALRTIRQHFEEAAATGEAGAAAGELPWAASSSS